MRGLVMDFQKDKNVTNIGDQYMFGPSLLVNPVYHYKATSRKVYLPANTGWYDLYTGKYFSGGETIDADAPYERMPLFVKEGSIIPIGPELQYTSQKPADTITLRVYSGKDAEFTLYEDEDVNYNYEKGAFSTIKINYNEQAGTITIGEQKGSFPGMLKQRVFKVTRISKQQAKGLDLDVKEDQQVTYNGKSITIKL